MKKILLIAVLASSGAVFAAQTRPVGWGGTVSRPSGTSGMAPGIYGGVSTVVSRPPMPTGPMIGGYSAGGSFNPLNPLNISHNTGEQRSN